MAKRTTAVLDTAGNRSAAAAFREAGDELILLPDLVPERPGERVKGWAPGHFDWLVFHDIRSVPAFSDAAGAAGIDIFELDRVMVCARGEAVADQLRFLQLHADLVPANVSPEGVTAAMIDYVGGRQHMEGIRVLMIYSGDHPPAYARELGEIGADATELPVLQFSTDDTGISAKACALILGGAADRLYVGSAADVYDLEAVFRPTALAEAVKDTEVCAADPSAASALREAGIRFVIGTPELHPGPRS